MGTITVMFTGESGTPVGIIYRRLGTVIKLTEDEVVDLTVALRHLLASDDR